MYFVKNPKIGFFLKLLTIALTTVIYQLSQKHQGSQNDRQF